jgi:hypothetical protein
MFSEVIQTLDGRVEETLQNGDGRGHPQNGASRARAHQKGREVKLANERVIHYPPLKKSQLLCAFVRNKNGVLLFQILRQIFMHSHHRTFAARFLTPLILRGRMIQSIVFQP